MTESATNTETREPSGADEWARVAAEYYAEITLLQSGDHDPDHRARVRDAHERALAKGSDFL
jgi:hypothetical protein